LYLDRSCGHVVVFSFISNRFLSLIGKGGRDEENEYEEGGNEGGEEGRRKCGGEEKKKKKKRSKLCTNCYS
jgi:hypothetical protein